MKRLSLQFDFPGSLGETLSGRLEVPGGKVHAYAVFAHCFTCSKESLAAARISRKLAEAGVAVLRFDFTGLGKSQGDFANTNFSSNVEDLVAAAEHLGRQYETPSLLIGHSLGGAAVLMAASQLESIKAVVTVGAPSDVAHVFANFATGLPEIEAKGEAEVTLGGRTFRIKKQFLEDIRAQALLDVVPGLKRPLLFLHAPEDEIVAVKHAENLFAAAAYPKSFMALDGANHLLTKRQDAENVAVQIAAWALSALQMETEEEPASPHAAKGRVRVAETGEGKFVLDIDANGHRITADEPEESGGTNEGPDPFALLLSSLGACSVMTMRLYADRKGWPAGKITADLDRAVEPDPETGEKQHVFRKYISIEGLTDEAQRQRIFEIAERCPVHRVLTSEPPLITAELLPSE